MQAISELQKIRRWVRRGFIPVTLMKRVAVIADMRSSKSVLEALRGAGIAEKSEARWIKDKSERCHVLTRKGQRRLEAAVRKRKAQQ